MKSLKMTATADLAPHLRIYYGEETEVSRNSTPLLLNPPSFNVNEEIETMWDGRTPAARLSARIAA